MRGHVVACVLSLCAFSAGAQGAAADGTLRSALERGALALVHEREPLPVSRLLIGFQHEHVSEALAAQLGLVDTRGFVVTEVTTAMARSAGLQRFDLIRFVDGVVADQHTLDDAKMRAQVDGVLTLGVYRRGRLVEVPVTVVERH